MRLLLAVILLQACVSSNIQVGEDPPDAGPAVDSGRAVDGGTADVLGVDAPPSPDACPAAAVPEPFCYDAECELTDAVWDADLCEFECDPAPAECFADCDLDDECSVGHECCSGPECGFVARNSRGHEKYLLYCPEHTTPPELIARCIDGVCEVAEYSDCVPGEDACVALASNTACGGDIAINQVLIDQYIEHICPRGQDSPPECCAMLGEIVRPATCSADFWCEAAAL